MVLRLNDSRDSELTVLVRAAALPLAQIALDGDLHVLQRVPAVVRDRNSDAVVLVHVLTLRQGNCDVAVPANGYLRVLDGAASLIVLNLYGEGPARPVRVLIACGGVPVLVGAASSAGNSDLTIAVSVTGTVVIVLVRHLDEHTFHSALVLDQLDGNGSLILVVQQAARGHPDGQGVVLVEGNGGVGHGIFGVGVSHCHQQAAHGGLAVLVCGALVVDLLNLLRLQGFPADLALLVPAALAVRGGLLVYNPVSGLMPGGVGIVPFMGRAAPGAGVGGVAHLGAGGGGNLRLVVMAQGRLDNGPALLAELGLGTGGRVPGDVPGGVPALQTGGPAADAGVLGHALTGAGGVRDQSTLVPGMAQGVCVIRDK